MKDELKYANEQVNAAFGQAEIIWSAEESEREARKAGITIDAASAAISRAQAAQRLAAQIPIAAKALDAVRTELLVVSDAGAGCAHQEALSFCCHVHNSIVNALAMGSAFDDPVGILKLHAVLNTHSPPHSNLRNRMSDECARAQAARRICDCKTEGI